MTFLQLIKSSLFQVIKRKEKKKMEKQGADAHKQQREKFFLAHTIREKRDRDMAIFLIPHSMGFLVKEDRQRRKRLSYIFQSEMTTFPTITATGRDNVFRVVFGFHYSGSKGVFRRFFFAQFELVSSSLQWVFDTWVFCQRRRFLVVLDLGIRGNIRCMFLSVSWSLVDSKVMIDDNITNCVLLC